MVTEAKILECVEQWKPLIIGLARKYSNKIVSPEDLMSVGIMSIITNIGKWDPERGKLGTFLYTCIRNAIYSCAVSNCFPTSIPSGSCSILKRQKLMRGESIELSRIKAETPNLDMQIDIDEIIEKNDRDHIAYKYFREQKTYEEIAQETGVSTATISRHITMIREKIRDYLKEE